MAEILRIHPENPQARLLQKAAEVLKAGGLVIYPSDTVYAIGCDISNQKAMARLAAIKGIKPEKAVFSIICTDLSNISKYTKNIDSAAFRVLKGHTPGPFTFILNANRELPSFYKGHKTVGIRVPDHPIPRMLTEMLGHPLSSTSIKDEDDLLEYPTDPDRIAEQYDHLADLIIDAGPGGNVPSTVVDLTGGAPEIIREGKGQL